MWSKRNLSLAGVLAGLLMLLSACSPYGSSEKYTELNISAAASLSGALGDIQEVYEKQHSNVKLLINHASSGTLRQQIEQGVPADVFISADQRNMDELLREHRIDPEYHAPLLNNRLVIVVPHDQQSMLKLPANLTADTYRRIAVGQPETVPAGEYTKQSLTHSKLWDTLKDKLIYAKDVRQVLSLVGSGNADAGFVYETDALSSRDVTIALHLDPKSHLPIEYPTGIIQDAKEKDQAKLFYTFLFSDEAMDIFEKYGFTSATH